MRHTALVLLLLLTSACAAPVAANPHPDEAKWRADMRQAITAKGWAEECEEFRAMAPEERLQAGASLVAFNIVSDAEAAARYLVVAADECQRTKP